LKNQIISFLVNSPKKSLIIGLIISVVSTLGLFKLKADFSYRGYYHKSNPLLTQYDNFEKAFSGDDSVAIIIDSKKDIFSKEMIGLVQKLTKDLEEAPHVIKVTSLSNHVQIKADNDDILIEEFIYDDEELTQEFLEDKRVEAHKDKIIPRYLLSDNDKSTVIVGRLRPSFNQKVDYNETKKFLDNLIKKYESNDYRLLLSGNSLVTLTFREISLKDLMLIIPLCLLMIAAIIFYLYRSVIPIFIVFAVMGFSVTATLGLAGFINVKYSNIIGAVPVILMAIGIADCVHFFSLYFKELKKGLEAPKAISVTLEHILFPTFLTSFSTSLGFISLAPSQVLPISGLGMLGAYGAILAWLLTLLVCAPLSLMFIKKCSKKSESFVDISHSKIQKFIEALYKKRILIIASTLFLVVSSLYLGQKNIVDSDPMSYLADDVPLKKATKFIDKHIGGVYGIEIIADSKKKDGINDPDFANKVEKLSHWLAKREGYTKVLSYLDIIKRVHKALNQGKEEFYSIPQTRDKIGQMMFLYELSIPQGNSITDQVSVDKSRVRVSGLWTLHSSSQILKEINLIEDKLKELNLEGHVSGKMPVYHNMNNYVVSDFFKSIGSAVIIIAILMILIFRSVPLGLLSMIPNVLPIIMGSGVLFLMGKNFDMGTVIVGAICLGIAVDDTIHFLSTYALMRDKGLEIKEALVETLHYVGVPLVSTTIILACGFGVFILGKFVPNSNLGLMTSIVLTFALLLDLILLPTILLMGAQAKSTKNS